MVVGDGFLPCTGFGGLEADGDMGGHGFVVYGMWDILDRGTTTMDDTKPRE